MRYCTNCGTPVNEGVKFCTNCGAKIEAPQPEPEQAFSETPAFSEQPGLKLPTEPVPEQPVYTPEQPVYTPTAAPEKKSHKALWIVMAVVALLLIAAVVGLLLWKPWSSCSGSSTRSTADIEDTLRTAFTNMQDVNSMHIEMTEDVDLTMSLPDMGYSQDMQIMLGISGDQQKDPDRARFEISMNTMGYTQSALTYAETVDGKVYTYISNDNGRTWTSSNEIPAIQNPYSQIETWLKHAKDYQETGTDTLNGEKVTVYTCALDGQFFKEILSMTGENPLESIGADMDEILDEIDDFFVTFCVNGDGRLVRFTIDMKDAVRTLFDRAMESALNGAKLQIDTDIRTATVDVVISKFNAIDPIEIPEAAKH